jgi:hypothetical protein
MLQVPVNVFLPGTYEGVLFIENQDTYAAATGGQPLECRSFALVYASGFRSSAARVRFREGALLHYAGPGAESLKLRFEHGGSIAKRQPGLCCSGATSTSPACRS